MSEAPTQGASLQYDLGRVGALEAAVGASPSKGSEWGALGQAYRTLGQDELALWALRRAGELGTRRSEDWLQLSLLAERHGRGVEALAAARVAVTLAPGSARLLGNLATQLLSQGRPHEALPYLEKAMRLEPSWPEPIGLLGLAHYDAGRYPEAAECLDAALRIDPDGNLNAWVCLGVSLHEIGRHEAAIHAFETAVFAKPDYGWAWGRLGKSLRALGRHVEAVAAFGKALQHDFAPPRLLAEMGDSAAETGNVTCLSEVIRRLKPVDRKTARALGRRLNRLQPPAPDLQAESPSSQAPVIKRRAGSRGLRRPATDQQAESPGSDTDAPLPRSHRTTGERERGAKL